MRIRKPLLWIGYLLLMLVLVEATGHLAFRITQNKWFASSELKRQRLTLLEKLRLRDKALTDEANQKPNTEGGWSVQIVHPYIGYVVDFHEKDCGTTGFCDDRIRAYNRQFPGQDFVPKTDENLIVALTGGSFAYGVGNTSTPGKWESALASIPAFADKKIYFYTLALGGLKQPQQLNAMSMFLGMGVKFDMIINVDGFNEIALAVSENAPWGISPFFPRLWSRLVRGSKADAKLRRLEGEVSFYQNQQVEYANQYQTGWYRNSALANLLWISGNQKLNAQIGRAKINLLDYGKSTKKKPTSTLEATGPSFVSKEFDAVMASAVDFWARSSQSLQAIANAHNVPYFQFLQPNQYIEGSKILSKKELKEAIIVEGNPYARAAKAGYPLLSEAGKQLIASQVNFTDLTQMFANNSEDLYIDSCCHVNQRGYDYVIDEIIKVVREHFQSE